ncbi:MAG: hypothetical protein RR296_10570 [Clostridia bacterium]
MLRRKGKVILLLVACIVVAISGCAHTPDAAQTSAAQTSATQTSAAPALAEATENPAVADAVDASAQRATLADEALYAYAVDVAKLNDISEIIRGFFGDDAQRLARDRKEKEFVAYTSKNGEYVINLDEATGYFNMGKPGKIPRYYNDGSDFGMLNPPVSEFAGRYTGEEAAEIGLRFLEEVVGMEITNLAVGKIAYQEAGKEKSRMYAISYVYRLDDRAVLPWPNDAGVTLWVSDDGVEGVDSGVALTFTRGEAISTQALLTEQNIIERANWPMASTYELVYQVRRGKKGYALYPVWNLVTNADNPMAYDAYSGQLVEVW